jgi:hypothetical protein
MSNSPFIGAGGEPQLVDCAVLFFDLLGVSAMAQGSAAQAELERFDETIRDASPYPIGAAAAAAEGAYPATVFSDSVIAAVPIETDLPDFLALFTLVLDVARLQTDMALREYFARGAITLDQFHFHDGLVFGPALVEAVYLERAVAGDPRIVLSPAATLALRRILDPDNPYVEPPVLVDKDGLVFVDYLGGALRIDPEFDLPSKLSRHREVVTKQLERTETNFPRWSKHRWVAEYHNATCRSYAEVLADHGGVEDFFVYSIHTERDFSTFS